MDRIFPLKLSITKYLIFFYYMYFMAFLILFTQRNKRIYGVCFELEEASKNHSKVWQTWENENENHLIYLFYFYYTLKHIFYFILFWDGIFF